MNMPLSFRELEPVRVIGWIMTTLVVVGSVAKQVADTYDEGTGWLGLAFAVMLAVGTEMQRNRVTPVAKIEETRLRRRYEGGQ